MKMIVQLEVTESQALTLQAMFDYWNWLGSAGASRHVSFYVDGDGNFQPKCEYSFSEKLPELTKEMRKMAVIEDDRGHRKYDFDPIAWYLDKPPCDSNSTCTKTGLPPVGKLRDFIKRLFEKGSSQ